MPTAEERAQLEENVLAEGCREALVVWKGYGILLDGHTRYQLCQMYHLPLRVLEIDLPDRKAARDWMINNQLGRQYGVDPATIRRDGKFAESLDKAAENCGEDRQAILSGGTKLTKKQVEKMAEWEPEEQKQAVEDLKAAKSAQARKSDAPPEKITVPTEPRSLALVLSYEGPGIPKQPVPEAALLRTE